MKELLLTANYLYAEFRHLLTDKVINLSLARGPCSDRCITYYNYVGALTCAISLNMYASSIQKLHL